MRSLAAVILALSVSACASGSGNKVPTPVPRAPTVAPPAPGSFRGPPMPEVGGRAGIMGANAAALTQRFGEARIDLTEGDARKLQFRGSTCVLDIFLYPVSAGAQPVATHIEARLRKDGSSTDEVSCIREVESQR